MRKAEKVARETGNPNLLGVRPHIAEAIHTYNDGLTLRASIELELAPKLAEMRQRDALIDSIGSVGQGYETNGESDTVCQNDSILKT